MILVTGATGNVGRPLVEMVTARGAEVRAVTRDRQAAGLSCEVVEGDAASPDSLRGVTALFVNPRAVGTEVDRLLAAAAGSGVRRVVALSANNVDDDFSRQPSRFRGDRNKETEDAVIASGLQWVSVRASTFAPNSVGMWGEQIRAGDVVRGPYANAAETPVDPRDIAAVAAVALLEDDLLGRRVEVTGPQTLTQREMVGVIGTVLGRQLEYVDIAPELARKVILGKGFSEAFVDANLARLAALVDSPAVVAPDAEKILGRPPASFADWVSRNEAAFR